MLSNIQKNISSLNPLRLARLVTQQRVERFIYYIRAKQYGIILDRIKRLIFVGNVQKIELRLVLPEDVMSRREFEHCSNPLVSIIVPVFNKWEHTRDCLTAVHMHTNGVPYEVIIADDASIDETQNIDAYFGNIIVVKNSKNLGFLRNCNAAAKKAHGKYLLFLNNDTNVQPQWLERLIDIFDADSQVGLVGPMLVYPNGKLQEAGGIIWNNGDGWNYGCQDYPERSEYNYVKEVDYISGACILVRRHIWEELNGFDERYTPAYYEDTDLAFGVRKRGYNVVYQPLSRVVHFEGVSHGKDVSSGIKRYQDENRIKFESKWHNELISRHLSGPEELFIARDRSAGKKILLFIDHYVPMPDRDAGSKSTFQYLQLLCEMGYTVKFIGDNYVDYQPYTEKLQQLGIEVLYGAWYQRNWKKWIQNNSKYIDYIYLSRPHIAKKYLPFVKQHSNAKLIYCGHDLHYLREARRYEIDKNEVNLKESRKWEKLEKYIVGNVDVSYFFSEFEVKELKKALPASEMKAIPLFFYNKVNEEKEVTDSEYSRRRGLLFVGGFMHAPNRDAVEWFINEIFPLIRETHPDIIFYVVGSNPPVELKNMDKNGVKILGEVSEEQLRNIYSEVRMVVAPLRFGAGVKGKILESMGHGVPVVTTSVGAEGIHDANIALRIADEPSQIAEQVNSMYGKSEAWIHAVNIGLQVLNNYYTKSAAREILLNDMPQD